MLVPMSKEEFVARMIADAKKRQKEQEEQEKANQRAVTEYIYSVRNKRYHKFHMNSRKHRLGVGR